MKNITVSVNDELYHRARVRAAEKRRSLSALVREYLVRMTEEEPGFERMQRDQNQTIARIRADHAGHSAAARMTRDEVHERHALR